MITEKKESNKDFSCSVHSNFINTVHFWNDSEFESLKPVHDSYLPWGGAKLRIWLLLISCVCVDLFLFFSRMVKFSNILGYAPISCWCSPHQDLSFEGGGEGREPWGISVFLDLRHRGVFGLAIVLPEHLSPQGIHSQQTAQRMSWWSGLTFGLASRAPYIALCTLNQASSTVLQAGGLFWDNWKSANHSKRAFFPGTSFFKQNGWRWTRKITPRIISSDKSE